MSEDCLYLNVWTGADSADATLPVLVWFHGGGFIEGSGSIPSFNGEALAQKGVVVVTINYRLGVFGYLAHPELSKESSDQVSGNYAVLDQIESLKWIQYNIAAFGGDSGNVTIAGQSAGAVSVHALMASPLAEGLFHKAIIQSGNMVAFAAPDPLADAELTGQKYAESRGAASLEELRALSTDKLLPETIAEYRAFGFRPNFDGKVLASDPVKSLKEGTLANPVPVLIGATANEFTSLVPQMQMNAKDYIEQSKKRYGEFFDQFIALYPIDSDEAAYQTLIDSGSDGVFAAQRVWAQAQTKHQQGTVFLYYFTRKLPGRDSARYGAFHSSELYYTFGTLDSTDRPWEDLDRKLADTMTSYWANFITHGEPNGVDLPQWPEYNMEDEQVMYLGDAVSAGPIPRKERMDLLTTLRWK